MVIFSCIFAMRDTLPKTI
uniref:Uncharacterized protein n=1 Tax=Anguilla anguilla TaxID=7936 RepID=A0A0E9TUP9_ANGAN